MDIEGHLFTITEAAKAVGISRSTVLRLEEAGFLEPRKVDPKNGFRYYDMDNIAQMGQYCILKRLGLKQDEIVSIYYGRADAKKALDNIEKELAQMKTRLEEYRIRYDKKRHHKFSFIDIPDVTCYTDVTEVSGMAEVEVFAYRTAESCVKAGYKTLLGSEPLFLISYGMEQVSFDAPPDHRRVMMCVPIDASETGEVSSDEHIKLIPGCHAFSFLSYGPTNEPYKNFAMLLQEVKKRELKMAGSVRGYGIVSPYVGSHIPEKDFVSRYVLPVERE